MRFLHNLLLLTALALCATHVTKAFILPNNVVIWKAGTPIDGVRRSLTELVNVVQNDALHRNPDAPVQGLYEGAVDEFFQHARSTNRFTGGRRFTDITGTEWNYWITQRTRQRFQQLPPERKIPPGSS